VQISEFDTPAQVAFPCFGAHQFQVAMFSSGRVLYGALSKVPPLVRMAVLGAPRLQPTRGPAISFQAFSTIVKTFKSQHKAPPSDTVVKNERISFPTMRVVYPGINGGNEWKIMTRTEALQFASEREGDLIVGKSLVDAYSSYVMYNLAQRILPYMLVQ
jgi:hypothetical protein